MDINSKYRVSCWKNKYVSIIIDIIRFHLIFNVVFVIETNLKQRTIKFTNQKAMERY